VGLLGTVMRALTLFALLTVSTPAVAGSLVELETPRVIAEAIQDPVSEDYCRCLSEVRFRLARPARISLREQGRALRGLVDGGEAVDLAAVPLGAGSHRIVLYGEGGMVGSRTPFVLEAQDAKDPKQKETAEGVIESDLANPPVLTVGRVFVGGVDLLDGHVVLQATDHEVKLGTLDLSVQRTYTSAGWRSAGVLGAGWAFTWQRTLTMHPACKLYAVQMADGSTLAFRRREDGTFEPPRGYRSRLVDYADGSFAFFDLAGNRYRFRPPLSASSLPDRLRLEHVATASGERMELHYEEAGSLARVEALDEAGRTLWTLKLDHVRVAGFDRITAISDAQRQVTLRYAYDDLGNLVKVTRENAEGATTLARYAYTADDARDPHQVALAEEGQASTRWTYHGEHDHLAGEDTRVLGLLLFGKQEYAREVRQTGGGANRTMSYAYDYAGWRERTLRTRVAVEDEKGRTTTLYVMDLKGRLLESKEEKADPPGGQRVASRSQGATVDSTPNELANEAKERLSP
jgi:YD repeat-containing protein